MGYLSMKNKKIKVCMLSATPLAAAPYELMQCLNKYTKNVKVRSISERNSYMDGRSFPYDVLLRDGISKTILRMADIWHMHNNVFPINYFNSLENQKILAQFHSLPIRPTFNNLSAIANACYTIDQPLHKREYGLTGLPNVIDIEKYKPRDNWLDLENRPIRIAFAPTSKTPVGNLDSKAYSSVRAILYTLAKQKDIEVVWIEGVDYIENLELKKGVDILIDDVATGNWHRTSLEGMSFGLAVINNIKRDPFINASLDNLVAVLKMLVKNRGVLRRYKENSRSWIEKNWHPKDKCQEYVDAYTELMKP